MTDINTLLNIMDQLRDPQDGCPWDLEQDFRSIVPHTLEEAYEVADTIERDDLDSLCGELGDLLFQVVFYARLAKEAEQFSFQDVVSGICEKLLQRHPHVFGESVVEDAAQQTVEWEKHKEQERRDKANTRGERSSLFDDVPLALPALSRTRKLVSRAARQGFDWPDVNGALNKLQEEMEELEQAIAEHEQASGDPTNKNTLQSSRQFKDHINHELGDVLFCVTTVARKLDIDADQALRDANSRFEFRVGHVETALRAEHKAMKDASLEEMFRHWKVAKTMEAG